MKTTLAGLFAALAAVFTDTIQHGASVLDWKTWIVPLALAAIGYFAKDHKDPPASTPADPGAPTAAATAVQAIAPLLMFAAVATFALGATSCATTTTTEPDGTVVKSQTFATVDQIKAAGDVAAEIKQPKPVLVVGPNP